MAMNLLDPVDDSHGWETKSKLDEDKEGNAVDPSHYRGMIGTLLYLTASRPDLQFAICMCARSKQYRHPDFTSIKSMFEMCEIETLLVNTNINWRTSSLKPLDEKELKFLSTSWEWRSFAPRTLKQLVDEVDE
ncbi:hypothetical protein Tco_0964952 [Tanacetum coccineum]